jgi:hypothetical protein
MRGKPGGKPGQTTFFPFFRGNRGYRDRANTRKRGLSLFFLLVCPCFSSYEEARRLAFGRERAWHDEAQFLLEAREEGRKEGRDDALHQTATNLIRNTGLDNASIAAVTALDIGEIAALRGDV